MIAHRLRDAALAGLARLPVRPATDTGPEVVLVRPDHLGDLLFLTPGLDRFRRALPRTRITLAVGPWSRAVAENASADEVVTVPFPGFTRSARGHPIEPYLQLRSWADDLRRRRPQAVVILRDDHWWGALAAQRAGIPVRIGADHSAVRRYLTHPIRLAAAHWVRRNADILDAAAALLGDKPPDAPVNPATSPLRWTVAPQARAAASRLLSEHGVTTAFVAIHPGSGAPVKLWPADRWARLADTLAARHDLAIVLTGSAVESVEVHRIKSAMAAPVISLAGETDLTTLAALFQEARLVAGVDSGPLHLAVAVGTPTVHLYGPSFVEQYGPWGAPDRHRVVTAGLRCPDCGNLSLARPEGAGCMLAISVDAAIAASEELVSNA